MMVQSGKHDGVDAPRVRPLRPKEQDAIEFVLPTNHQGYGEYRSLIAGLAVIGPGRRGAGNFVLGIPGDSVDLTSPLAPVVAYGAIETITDTYTITVREHTGNQVDVEIVGGKGGEIPDHYEEKRRWTYSTWLPGAPSPASQAMPREVRVNALVTLAIVPEERRLWVHDGATQMNHLIPITNFYNELMLHKAIRDPRIALTSNLLFEQLNQYTDEDMRSAFLAYNRVHKKVDMPHQLTTKASRPSLATRLIRVFLKKQT